MDQYKLKQLLVRTIVILDEIKCYDLALRKQVTELEKLRIIRQCFLPLNNLLDSFQYYNFWMKNKTELLSSKKGLRQRLEFTKHVRNIISGHLDDLAIQKACEWEPTIFSEGAKENMDTQLLFSYKSLIEIAINSYIDKDEVQKIFKTEIDLLYPPDQSAFLSFLDSVNTDCIQFLEQVCTELKKEVFYHKFEEGIDLYINAGGTNCNIKKKNSS